MKIVANNLAVNYEDEGNGPVMVLLHGWKDTLHTFDPLVPLLAAQYRVVRLDLPGFGGTEAPSSSWHLNDYIEFVAAFIQKLGFTPDYFVGHSFGGRILIKGTAENKLKAKKIVLIAPAGIAKTNTARNHGFKLLAKTGKILTSVPPLSNFRGSLRKKLYDAAGSDYLGAGALTQIYLNIIREDLSDAMRKISLPSLLIWGSLDTTTPLSDGRFLERIIPGTRLVVLDGKTHHTHQEDPTTVASLIKEFCA